MADPRESDDVEGQDIAETFDEENITTDGRDIATSDMQRDVYDVTTAAEDADLDEVLAPEADFDPDRMDEVEYEEIVQGEEDLDVPRTFAGDDENRVREDDLQPQDLESERLADDDIEALGYGETDAEDLDARLDEAVEETFPASDPIAVHPRRD